MTAAATRSAPSAAPEIDPDAELLRRVASGDTAALGAAFDRYHRDVYAFLARVRCSRHDLDDLVQTTFLALPAAAAGYDGRASVRAFLLGVSLQHARRERRRIFRRFALWAKRTDEVDVPVGAPDPEAQAIGHESLKRFEKALAALPDALRETFVMVEVEGIKGEQAAAALGIPVNTVWTRLHHARIALRKALDAGGGQ